ncbi:hypothetical protein [Actinomycetospora sp. TBRC 11914]|uniref:hypothetical protein n=1 Tax=Actinomycetospora sp. TBRC 11914 TaxID=2729387 RepID=UPI00145E45DC|nr:hypothetical protein [Actinomycetospora sp. TBRC 11914]NMO88577.1 hypothetical protein [Actinomycetospora sp. TBRC 11914]
MTFDDPAVAQARTATDALRELERSGGHLLADPAVRRRWGVDLLEELAQLASALAEAVEVASGSAGPDISDPAFELAEAIRRRRDSLDALDRVTPALPAVGNDEGRGSPGPKHRAHRHLRPVR